MIVCNLKYISSGSNEPLSYWLHIAFIYALKCLDILTLQIQTTIYYQGGIIMSIQKSFSTLMFLLTTILLITFFVTGCTISPRPSQSPSDAGATSPTQTQSPAEADSENTISVYEQQKKDGTIVYSLDDGNTWISQKEFEEEYPTHNIEWWTYDEYAEYIEQQKVSLQEMVNNHITGYTENRGDFIWTQELADETIQKYEQNLQQIKNGVKISKSIEGLDDDCGYESYSLDPKSLPVISYEISLPDSSTKQFTGENKTEIIEKVKDYCKQQIEAGKLTQDEADKILNEIE